MERVRVMVGACRCPGRPHPEDWVELAARIPIAVGAGVMAAMRASRGDDVRLASLMAQVYVENGIVAWSFTGPIEVEGERQGWPILVDASAPEWRETLAELLPWDQGGAEVADKASGLYSENILRPLTGRTLTQSLDGQTAGLTSPIQESSRPRPARSRRSSPTTTAGKPSEATAP